MAYERTIQAIQVVRERSVLRPSVRLPSNASVSRPSVRLPSPYVRNTIDRTSETFDREMSMVLIEALSSFSRIRYKFYERNLLGASIKNTCIARAVYTRMKKVSFSLFFLTTPFSMFGKQVNPSRNLYILYQGKIPGFSKMENICIFWPHFEHHFLSHKLKSN